MKSMASMKILLRLLGAGALTTGTATSVVPCGDKDKALGTSMDAKVAEAFGFVDAVTNKSKVVVGIDIERYSDTALWTSPQIDGGITANNLLRANYFPNVTDKAVSVEAGDFLVNVFKLQVVSGTGADRLFKHSDAVAIAMSVKTWAPTIAHNTLNTDYVVTGGTVVVQFIKKGGEQLGDNYAINILALPYNGIVAGRVPQLILSDFNVDFQNKFAVGKPVAYFQEKTNLIPELNNDNYRDVKQISSLQALIKQGATKVLVTTNAKTTGNFVTNDTIKIQVSIGDIKFSEVTLTVNP